MRIRTRMFLAFFMIGAASFYLLIDWIADDLRFKYQAAMEESMVDTATLLASLIEEEVTEAGIETGGLRAAFARAREKTLAARIYTYTKTQVNMRVYVTDAEGIVLFDSDGGGAEGEDYARWNDVLRTLRGEYGARATRSDPEDPMTAVLYVASPIRANGAIVGVLSVGKPADSVAAFLAAAQRETAIGGIIAAIAAVLLGVAVSAWVTQPIQRLTRYALAVRDGQRGSLPKLGKSEIGVLGAAFEEMRVALEGKQYVENYVQTLTHQMKSPVSAIRGAAELIDEDMPAEQRAHFLANIRSESDRIQDLIDRMLQLAALENRKALRDLEDIALDDLIVGVVEGLSAAMASKKLRVSVNAGRGEVLRGECFLLRQALANLLQNAIDFSPDAGAISVSLARSGTEIEVRIADQGPGIPEYALDRAFERFYSLPRPDTGKKSSGLGLAFVREVAQLHGGRVALANAPEGGAEAVLVLPAGAA